jgi:hypothetical protein
MAITNSSNNQLESKLAGEPPDVLSATNLEQWKSLIRDLKQVALVPRHWTTDRFRVGAPPVLLKHNGQTIIYRAEAVDVSLLSSTEDFLEAEIYSPKMNINETRELGLKQCSMFDFDTNKFLTWCNSVGNNWLDAPMFSQTDHSHLHFLKVRKSYNDERPWYIVFAVSEESAVKKLMGKSSN